MNTSLVNAVPFKVTHRDGTVETVNYKELDIIELYSFVEFITGNKTPHLVALCTGKDLDWIRTLETKSYAQLSAKCIELNLESAIALAEDPVIALKLHPLLTQMTEMAATLTPEQLKELEKKFSTRGQLTSSSSSAPAASESAGGTGSGASA
ncbi:MAG TPA: hypothetical protein VIO16_04935 [Dehalococcoidia bacterium]